MNKKKILSLCMLAGLGLSSSVFAATVVVNNPFAGAEQYGAVMPGNGPFGQQQQYQQEPAPIPDSATNIAAKEKAEQQKASNQNGQASQDNSPKTAFEQGYGQQETDLKKEIEDYKEFNSARQKGTVVTVPMPSTSWAKSRENRIWLTNWKGVLTEQAGLSLNKIDFEASRLSKEEFEDWASRQVRVSNPNANYVDY